MGNILDYLDWRGDLTFEQSPFNEVDNLILACFSYLDLDERAEVKNGNTLSVEELFAAFSRREMKKDLKAESAFLQNTPVLLEKMACAERFRKCTVGGCVNEILSSRSFAQKGVGISGNAWNLYTVHAADRRSFQRRKSGYVCSDAVQ